MKKTLMIIAVFAMIGLTGCTKPQATTEFLTAQGYTNVVITGWRPFMKGEEDVFSTGFKAKNVSSGATVTGAVTQGWFKGKTIRYD